MPRLRTALLLSALPLILVSVIGAAAQNNPRALSYDWFDPIIDLRQLVEAGYVEEPDARAMQEAALAAMVAALNDPFSVYVPPSAERDFTKSLRGSYVGIGAEIDMPDGWLRIISPLDDSPAEEAGVLPGDIVLSIDGEPTRGKSADECIDLLLGEPNTSVRLEVRHPDGREEVLTIPRREIQARSLRGFRRASEGWEHLIDSERGIAYVRMTQFLEHSAEDLKALLNELRPRGLRGIILDLRFNGGGSLASAIRVVDLFLAEGGIVSVRGREGREGMERSWSAQAQADDIDLPLVILVNEASASASEIVAGALQENDRAKILGSRTYGKGTVQDVRPLGPGKGSVKLTIARYVLPGGRTIARTATSEEEGGRWGVDPDPGFHVSIEDEAVRHLFRARRRWDLPHDQPADPANWSNPAWIEAHPDDEGALGLGDPQLAAALRALQGRLDSGAWPRVGDDPTSDTIAAEELRRQTAYRSRLQRELEAVERRIADLRFEATSQPHEVEETK